MLVLAELDYWCAARRAAHAWLTFLDDVLAGVYRPESPSTGDLARAREVQETYRDLALGVVDATVIALAERLREPRIATLDRRRFSTVRPAHVPGFQLLP